MSDEKKQPWPASWPPFWRTVLHIAIAAAAGNVVLVTTLFLPALSTKPSYLFPLCLMSVTIALVCGRLAQEKRRTILVLAVAFLLGTLTHRMSIHRMLIPSGDTEY